MTFPELAGFGEIGVIAIMDGLEDTERKGKKRKGKEKRGRGRKGKERKETSH